MTANRTLAVATSLVPSAFTRWTITSRTSAATSASCGENVMVRGGTAPAGEKRAVEKGEATNGAVLAFCARTWSNTAPYSAAVASSSKTSTWLELTYNPVTEKL